MLAGLVGDLMLSALKQNDRAAVNGAAPHAPVAGIPKERAAAAQKNPARGGVPVRLRVTRWIAVSLCRCPKALTCRVITSIYCFRLERLGLAPRVKIQSRMSIHALAAPNSANNVATALTRARVDRPSFSFRFCGAQCSGIEFNCPVVY